MGKGSRFAFESCEAFGVLCEGFWECLDGDGSVEARVAAQVDDTHAASAEFSGDFVWADAVGHAAMVVDRMTAVLYTIG